MKDEGVAAILGLVLLTHENNEVRIPAEAVVRGLPDNSGVQVYQDPVTDELVIRVIDYEEETETE